MRIKNLPSIESMDGSQDALVIEQTDGSEDKSRKVSPAQIKQYVLGEVDEVPTEDSDNLVKSGGIFSTMAVPKYDSATETEYFEGGSAFSGNIDSTPTSRSNNAVSSGGTFTALSGKLDSLLTADSSGSVDVDGTFQIPSAMLNRTLIVITINRYALAGGVVLAARQITGGDTAKGVKIVVGASNNPTQSMYAILTISAAGLITVKNLTNYAPIFIHVVAI